MCIVSERPLQTSRLDCYRCSWFGICGWISGRRWRSRAFWELAACSSYISSHSSRCISILIWLSMYSASSAVIVRIPYLQNYKDHEFLYATTSISILSNVEAGLGITAGSLTTLRPLFRLFRESPSASQSHGHNLDSFPFSSTLGKNTGGTGVGKGFLSSPDPHDDTQQLWPGSADNDNCNGVQTVITGNHWANAASSSKDDLSLMAMDMGEKG